MVLQPIKEGVDKATAEELKTKLTEAGAEVEIAQANNSEIALKAGEQSSAFSFYEVGNSQVYK